MTDEVKAEQQSKSFEDAVARNFGIIFNELQGINQDVAGLYAGYEVLLRVLIKNNITSEEEVAEIAKAVSQEMEVAIRKQQESSTEEAIATAVKEAIGEEAITSK